jgi:hypothetical protein
MNSPQTYQGLKLAWKNNGQSLVNQYTSKQTHCIPNLLPEDAVQIPTQGVLYILEQRFGASAIKQAIDYECVIESPAHQYTDTTWMKQTNMVGINVRTVQSFWNVVKYMLTIPQSIDSVHLLPIWEPGVVASLYGITSWNINAEFFSNELYRAIPKLDTVEKQLKVVVNLLHLMGKKVGMDVIPHTDRYAEIALANPRYYEWLQRRDTEIINHENNLYLKVQETVLSWLKQVGAATNIEYPTIATDFFSENFGEQNRLLVLFGLKEYPSQRNQRRNKLIQALYNEGYETVPATMAPPYRGLIVNPDDAAKTIDDDGRVWRDYIMTNPTPMSRVFGPLSRFRLFESKDDNCNWEVNFDAPIYEAWNYVCGKFDECQRTYNFDFMRGDMSHVQTRPEGVPTNIDAFYDIQRAVKRTVLQSKPYFGYFGESFLVAPNTMGFGDENAHLEASEADTTLGDLQSMVVGSEEFMRSFAYYLDLLHHRKFAPNFTVMTADKDDPRFDAFYLKGNMVRQFISFFLTEMPSYVGLGFEVRDSHSIRFPNECYTKLYVFQLKEGANATEGPYRWGKNEELFEQITRLRLLADKLLPTLQGVSVTWIQKPDATAKDKRIVWQVGKYMFVANLDLEQTQEMPININGSTLIYSTHSFPTIDLQAEECRIYEVVE